jgi:predicted TPR repeat methyltransferase
MIYIGDLANVFSGVARRLEQGGFYLFAVESMPGSSWEQSPMNRFRHSEAYLREEAARAGLEFVDLIERPLRQEASQAVGGFAVALRKPLLQ